MRSIASRSTKWMNLCFLVLLAASLQGCITGGPTVSTPAATGPIPIRVWRIQAFGDNIAFPQSNTGCRMPQEDIQVVVSNFLSESRVLSPNCVLSFDGTIGTIFSLWVFTRPHLINATRSDLQLAIADYYSDNDDGWDPDAINIYFVGDYQESDDPYARARAAATYEPSPFPGFRLVFVNDHGYESPSGYATGFSAMSIVNGHTLLHELGHYLGRFTNRCFAQNDPNRCYDALEHAPSNALNVMANANPVEPYLPGQPNDAVSEKGEIFTRIENGLWNSP